MNNPMAKITRLEGERRQSLVGPANRLTSAGELMRKYYHRLPLGQDHFEEQNAINAWITVTVCYSGIEQAIKFLLLRIQKNLDEIPEDYWHHRIGALFQELTEEQREVVRESYSIYRSLHDYIKPETVDAFLWEIDKGYPVWRYFLLEGGKSLPTTHCGAMLEIWFALSNIIEARVFSNRELYHCARRFRTLVSRCVHEARKKYADPETGEDEATNEDMVRWSGSRGCLLNSWAKMVHGHAIRTNELDVLPHAKTVLLASIDIAKKCAQLDQDFSYFLHRAQDPGITWNHREKRFETP